MSRNEIAVYVLGLLVDEERQLDDHEKALRDYVRAFAEAHRTQDQAVSHG